MSTRISRRDFITTAGKAGALVALGGVAGSAQAADTKDKEKEPTSTSSGPTPKGPYLAMAQTFLETLVENGRDHYGPRSVPLFCLSLDPDTYSPARPPEKVDWDYKRTGEALHRDYGYYYRSHLHGCNMIYEQGTIRALFALSEATGNLKYKRAADECLDFFLTNMVSEQTGIFGWGEHIFWNVFSDRLIGGSFGVANRRMFFFGHELERWTTIYDIMWEKSREKTLAEIDAIYEYKIHNYDTFECNRHSDYFSGKMGDLLTFVKHPGLFAHAFAFAHAKTGEQKYIDWARKMSDVFWNVRNTSTNLIPGCLQRNREWAEPEGMAQLALFLMRAHQWSPDQMLLDRGVAYMRACGKYAMSDVKGRAWRRVRVDGTPGPRSEAKMTINEAYIAKAAALAYSLSGQTEMLELADSIATAFVPGELAFATIERCNVGDDLETIGRGLSVDLDLYELTADKKYLDKAKALADHVKSNYIYRGLFVSPLGLANSVEGPYTSIIKVYDGRPGPGWLALNLMRLQRHCDATEAGTFSKQSKLDRIYD